jgi:hypothetical protein
MASKSLNRFLITATFSSLFVLAAHAQDPPTRVADLNYVTGNVSMQPAGADDWSPAVMNRPFTTGDNLWADTDGRAELHLNNATLRVGSQSSLGFLNLGDSVAQIRFTQGEFMLRVRRLGQDESFEVDTPNAAITILRGGEYRFNADPDAGTTWVVVRHGQAEVTGGGQAFTLNAGNSAQLSGTDQLAYDVQVAPQPDDFEAWSEGRDAHEAHLMSARYLPPDVIGYEELDNYGNWRDTPGYGAVWYPTVDASWAPYHNGHWAWVSPWGWTWVDDAPWGFAPSHYGRWAYVSGGWGWIPGPLAIVAGGPAMMTPVYAPAMVAFIGGGGWGASLSFGGPAVGWVPLGPGEIYAPAYQVSQNYFRTVNVSSTTIVNTVNITNVYTNVYMNKNVTNVVVNQRFANMAAPNAVTAMPQGAFASGRPVTQVGVSVPRAQATQIQTAAMTVAPRVAPVKQALAPMAGARPAPQPPARAMSVPIVAKVAPPPPPVSFAAAPHPAGILATPATGSRSNAPPPNVRVAPPARQVVPPVRPAQAAPPATPGYRPPAQPAPAPTPAYRPPAQPAPAPTPAYRPPAQPAPAPTPAYRPPAQPAPAPTPAYRPPAAPPQQQQKPPAKPTTKPATKSTQKPPKDEEKPKQ